MELKAAALTLAQKGYRVFPLVPKEKRPLNSNGCLGATSDLTQIEGWWSLNPDANIGVSTEGLCVVDVDPAGVDWFTDDANIFHVELLVQGFIQITGRGGRHYVFRNTGEEIRSCNNGIAKGIDIKAGGGYIVAAPSRTTAGPYRATWLEFDKLPPLPQELRDLIKSGQREHREHLKDADKYGQNERNEGLYALAIRMTSIGIRGEELRQNLHNANRARCYQPLPDREVDRIADNANKSDAAAKAAGEVEIDFSTLLNGLNIKEPKTNGLAYCTFADIEEKAVEWIWQDRIAAGKMHLLAGEQGIGKSFWLCWLASKLTTGGQWPDGGEINPGRVALMVGEDDPADTIKPRLRLHGAVMDRVQLIQAKWEDGKLVAINLDDSAGLLEQHCKKYPDLRCLIVDPVTEYLLAEGNDNGKVRQALRPITAVCRQYGLAVINLTHLRKPTSQSRGDDRELLNRVLGAGAFTAQARICHAFVRNDEDGSVEIRNVKNNLAAQAQPLSYRISAGAVQHVPTVNTSAVTERFKSSGAAGFDLNGSQSSGKVTEF